MICEVDGSYNDPSTLVNGVECYFAVETDEQEVAESILHQAKRKGYEACYDCDGGKFYLFWEPSFWDIVRY